MHPERALMGAALNLKSLVRHRTLCQALAEQQKAAEEAEHAKLQVPCFVLLFWI